MTIEMRRNPPIGIKGIICMAAALMMAAGSLRAQDTAKRKTINITSTFKPSLRNSAKISFNADAPPIDSARPNLTYNLPVQYLSLQYQPAGLNPVALPGDTLKTWGSDNYIKVGVGNVHLPYVKAGLSFGDKKYSFFNVFAEGYSSKGDLEYQKNSLFDAAITGTVKTPSNLEWNGKLGFRGEEYYLYGYQPKDLQFASSELQQQFLTFEGRIGLRNSVPTAYGLTYNPNLKVVAFGDNLKPRGTEINTVINLPLQKTVGDHFAINLGVTADLTHYTVTDVFTADNNLFYVSPAVVYHGDNLSIHAELTPSWDQKDFHLLPNLSADYTTNDKRFTLFAVFDGFYEKGSYQRFSTINPWLWQPGPLLNTRVQEFYGGFKGSLSNHVSYLAKAGMSEYRNMPLFLNDSLDGKNFRIVYEPKLNVFNVHGEITYIQGEQFTATAGLTLRNFKARQEYRAWGMLPLELNANLRWEILKDLWLKADLWTFDGAAYRGPDQLPRTASGGFDLNAGLEFRITRQLNLWLQMNNILNDKYQRWNQYPVYGFNILGGVIFSFGGKK
jgi:hypothetical protein